MCVNMNMKKKSFFGLLLCRKEETSEGRGEREERREG